MRDTLFFSSKHDPAVTRQTAAQLFPAGGSVFFLPFHFLPISLVTLGTGRIFLLPPFESFFDPPEKRLYAFF